MSGSLGPLRYRVFAVLWLATVASNVGTWMNDVGAGWLMTTLAPSPATVALVQASTTLAVFLFAIPAGALADIVDRRCLLLVINALMGLTVVLLTALVAAEAMTPALLLCFTFALGTGAAFIAPTWQSIVPGLVPREELPAAISLNSVGINISRAIGPAVAGVLIASVGLWAPFAVNALSFLGILAALWWWKGEPAGESHLPPEALVPAMVAGLRYARRSPALKRTIARAVAYFAFASAFWSMLPLIAKDVLGGGSGLYGVLLGCVGAGAVLGATQLPRLRARFEINRLILIGALGTAAAIAAMATVRVPAVAAVAALLAGASWITVLATFNVAAQTALPNWVRARGLSLFLTAFFGAMSGGSVLWGQVASHVGIAPALLAAAVLLAVSAVLSQRIRLEKGDGDELAASLHWPAPPVIPPDAGDAGPVLVTVDYPVRSEQVKELLSCLARLREARLRDGAYLWQAYRSLEEPGLIREAFMVRSWLDHLRQHARATEADRRLQDEAATFLVPGTRTTIRHHLPADHPAVRERAEIDE